MISSLIAEFAGPIIGVLGVIGAFFFITKTSERKGAQKERIKQVAEAYNEERQRTQLEADLTSRDRDDLERMLNPYLRDRNGSN